MARVPCNFIPVASFLLAFAVFSLPSVLASKEFDDGLHAYLTEQWGDCVTNFEACVAENRKRKEEDTKCRLNCEVDVVKITPLVLWGDEYLEYIGKLMTKSLCLRECDELTGSNETEVLESYDYLQSCYFHLNQPQDAASAAYTYLGLHSDNSLIAANLRTYTSVPDVDVFAVTNHEAQPFIKYFLAGVNSFNSGQFKESIASLELSLDGYMIAEEGCRVRCDRDIPDVPVRSTATYASVLAGHFATDLGCKRTCPRVVTTTNMQPHEDVLARHYHYLQVANGRIGNLPASCQALASYLEFHPGDRVKLAEKRQIERLSSDYSFLFQPRQEAFIYVHRKNHENELFNMIEKNMKNGGLTADGAGDFTAQEETAPNQNEDAGNSLLDAINNDLELNAIDSANRRKRTIDTEAVTDDCSAVLDETERESISDKMDLRVYREQFLKDVSLLKSGSELGGGNRLLAKGVADEDECKMMVNLAKVAAVPGTCYNARASRTEVVTYEGLTLGRLAKMVHEQRVAPRVLDTFVEIADRGRAFVERQFNVDQTLYFHTTRLVCQQGDPDEALLSPIHADNCTIRADGQCIPDEASNAFRNFSAIVYLNDDFDGGELILASDNSGSDESIQAEIPVVAGHMVAFSSGRDNLHGVRRVRNGKRCAMGLWFTLNPGQSEKERIVVQRYRDRARLGGEITEEVLRFLENQ